MRRRKKRKQNKAVFQSWRVQVVIPATITMIIIIILSNKNNILVSV